jgi:HK97 family phage portal protein
MRLFGFEVGRVKTPVPATTTPVGWTFNGPGDWLNNWPVVQEPFTGAWQRNMDTRLDSVLAFYAVYACINLIAGDIGKLTLRLVEKKKENVYEPVEVPAFSPVLRKPNGYQTRQQFMENWMVSKLTAGNTYVLKEYNNAGLVDEMHVLHPAMVRPMVSDLDGSIWYSVSNDPLVIEQRPDTDLMIPARFIIHDRFPPLGGHRLCGVSPITACALSAIQGINIQRSSSTFFANGAKPSGILTSDLTIDETTAKRLKDQWEANYTGTKIGKVAVLGDGLKYDPIMISAQDSQLVSQLKLTAEVVCTAFGVPPHKINVGPPPSYNNIEALDQNYYSGCLQKLIEAVESCLDQGLGLEKPEINYQTNLNIKDLLKMDTPTKVKTYIESVRGVLTTNEAREELGYDEVKGGDAVLSQQQNYDIAALAKRDAKEDPFAKADAAPKTPPKKPAQDAGSSEQLTPPPEPKMITDQRPQLSDEERRAAYQKGFNDCAAA